MSNYTLSLSLSKLTLFSLSLFLSFSLYNKTYNLYHHLIFLSPTSPPCLCNPPISLHYHPDQTPKPHFHFTTFSGRSPPLDFISSIENGQSSSGIHSTRHVTVLPTPSLAIHRAAEDKTKSEEPEPSNVNESSSSNKQPIQHPVFKRRKRHRRKHFENQEPCIMRGVYYKNMKWQAAIKVDKKQIHLGTVGSQEEAARLYDRAAFMCGREPNFELTEEQKEELSKLSWDDFLTMTRSAINSKKHQRRISSRMKFEHPSQDNSDIKAEVDVDQGGNSLSGYETSDS